MYGQIFLPKAIDVPKNFIYTVFSGLTHAAKKVFWRPKSKHGKGGQLTGVTLAILVNRSGLFVVYSPRPCKILL